MRGEHSVFSALQEMEAVQWMSASQVHERQRLRLTAILEYAARNCPWYREAIPIGTGGAPHQNVEDLLARCPVLTKDDLQTSLALLRSRSFRGRATAKTTGGSTGQPVILHKDRAATGREMAATWLSYGWFGVRIGDRSARFWGSPHTWRRRLRYFGADFAMNRVRFSAFSFNETDLSRYWHRMLRFQPQYLHGYVSMLEAVARFVQKEGWDGRRLAKLKVVVATAEVLSEPQRALLSETFGVPVLNEYGCGEVGPIAYGCPAGSLHIMTENLFVEILDDQGNPSAPGDAGHIVITDLNNRAMPLIRYQVGDFGVMGGPCPCGRGFPVLGSVWGRAYDFVEGPNGERFHGEFFMYAFEDLRSSGVPVQQFKVVQESQRRLRVLVRCGESQNHEVVPRIRKALVERLPGMEFVIETVSEIARAPSGKMRVIENPWRETGGTNGDGSAASGTP
jgi:phenylacetate-CoA ligase